MFTEAVSSGAVHPGKAPGGGAGRCSSANGGFSALLNKIFTPGLSAAPVSLKEERASSRGMKGSGSTDPEESGKPGEDSWSKEGAGWPFRERLQRVLRELLGDVFPTTGFLIQWNELPPPLKEQYLSILAGEFPGVQPQPGGDVSSAGNYLIEEAVLAVWAGTGRPEAGQPEAGKFLEDLVQGIGGNTGKAADIEGISGIYPGNAVEQGSGAAEERLRALFFNVTEEQLLTGRVAYHRGGLTGKGKPEEEVFLSNLVQGSGGDTGKGADSAGVPGVYPGDFKEQNTGAAGKEFFMDSGREATIAVKTPPPGEIIPDGGLEGQPQGGGEPFSDEGTLKGSSLVSTLYVEGAPGEGMGNASSSFVPPQSTGLLQHSFRDTMEQILQRMDYLVRQGGQELRLKLQPEFLGEVLIRMRRMRGVLSAEIITSHPAVKEMLEGQLDMLHRRFQQMNLDVQRFDVLLKDGGQNGFSFEREPRREEPLHHPGMDYRLPDGEGARVSVSGYFGGDRRVDYLV